MSSLVVLELSLLTGFHSYLIAQMRLSQTLVLLFLARVGPFSLLYYLEIAQDAWCPQFLYKELDKRTTVTMIDFTLKIFE